MSEIVKEIINTIKVPADISKSALEQPAKRIGQVLDSGLLMVFAPIIKAGMAKEHSLEIYKNELKTKLETIPEEKIVEPPLNIVGPALEASKYYIEDQEIRSMFSNLITSSMNSDFHNNVHPSFVEVIKQLSPFDAKQLSFLVSNGHSCGIGKIQVETNDAGINIWVNNFIPFPDMDDSNYHHYVSSVDNFIRLGIITVDFSYQFTTDSRYTSLENHLLLKQSKEHAETLTLKEEIKNHRLVKGIWKFTSFGERFISCCF